MTQIVFETFNAPAFYVFNAAVLALVFACDADTGPAICKAMERYAKEIVAQIQKERESGSGPARVAGGKRRMSVAVDGIGGVMQAAGVLGSAEKSFRVLGLGMQENGTTKKPLTLKVSPTCVLKLLRPFGWGLIAAQSLTPVRFHCAGWPAERPAIQRGIAAKLLVWQLAAAASAHSW